MKRTAKPPAPPMAADVPSSSHARHGAPDAAEGQSSSAGLGRALPPRAEPSRPRPLVPTTDRPTGPMQPVIPHFPVDQPSSDGWPSAPEPPPDEFRAPLPTIPVLSGPEHPSSSAFHAASAPSSAIPGSPMVPSWPAHDTPFGSVDHSMASAANEAPAEEAKLQEVGLRERILSGLSLSWGNDTSDPEPRRASDPYLAIEPMPFAAGVTSPYSSVGDVAQQPRAPGDSVPIGYYLASAVFLVIAVVGFGLWLAFAVI